MIFGFIFDSLTQAFAIFSGMGIANTQMYEKAIKAMAKQRVTLEVLSYHASAQEDEAQKVAVSLRSYQYYIFYY